MKKILFLAFAAMMATMSAMAQNIRQFERSHSIPVLPSGLQQKLNELWKTGE